MNPVSTRAALIPVIAGAAVITILLLLLSGATARAEFPNLRQFRISTEDRGAIPPARSTVPRRVRDPLIVGGNATTIEKYPWQVMSTWNGKEDCGGTLVHPLMVLTAAHCLIDDDGHFYADPVYHPGAEIHLYAGRTDPDSGGEELPIFSFWAPIDKYDPATFRHDYAIITLADPSGRPTIKIAGAGERALWRSGSRAVVTGYGDTYETDDPGPDASSPVLKELTIPVLDDSVCGSSHSYGNSFDPTMMLCAGAVSGGGDSCQGDSGGPLQTAIDGGGYRQTGIVSWGIGCARPNFPGIYTRIGGRSLGNEIAAFVDDVESQEGFPADYRTMSIFGSGARPVGCAAATRRAHGSAARLPGLRRKSKRGHRTVKRIRRSGSTPRIRSAKRRARRLDGNLRRGRKIAFRDHGHARSTCG